ncbi:MAG: hypothetical protein KF846_11235 [Cyclobacteriaceae bacterium]|nr:hypothetical protein [Cyclobacteriaceae bacterium]
MKSLGHVLCLVLVYCEAYSQYAVSRYTAIDGLPQSEVQALVEDSNGYLWLGTQGGGLARFDGKSFDVYTTRDGLLNNVIGNLFIDRNQYIWSSHVQGISRFDGKLFKTFVPPDAEDIGRISTMVQLRDTLFFTSVSGTLGKIFNDSVFYWNKSVHGQSIYRLHQMSFDEVFILLNDNRLIIRTVTSEQEILFPTVEINSLSFLWYKGKRSAIINGQLFEIDLLQKKVVPQSLNHTGNYRFYDERKEAFWYSWNNQLMQLHQREKAWESELMLRDVLVTTVISDVENNIWVATSGDGLYKFYERDFTQYYLPDVKSVLSVMVGREGSTWVGTSFKGLVRIRNGNVQVYRNHLEPRKDAATCLLENPDGSIWIGTYGGLGLYNPTRESFRWFTEADGIAPGSVFNLQRDNNGFLWIGMRNGLFRFDGETFKRFSVDDGLNSNLISATHYNSFHKSLFAASHSGLNQLNDKFQFHPLDQFKNTNIVSLASYRDSLVLIGSSGAGLGLFSPTQGLLTALTSRDGLPSDFIYLVKEDTEGYIWVGSEKGITRILFDDRFNIVSNFHFSHYNGLTGVETNQNAVFFTEDKKLFGLIDGLYEYNVKPHNVVEESPLHLTDIQLFYGDFKTEDYARGLEGFYKIPVALSLPYNRNHLTFKFNRVDKRNPQAVRFVYLLEGFDSKWSQPTSSGQVTYSNLPPGDYTFKINSTNSNGSWTNNGIVYSFTIAAPYYKKPFFIVTASVFFICVIAFVFYWRVRTRITRIRRLQKIREEEQEIIRREIARDFHDDMGNQLTRIINYVSLLRLNGSPVKTDELYGKVEHSAKYLYAGTRDFIWSINPESDELSILFLHLRDFAEKMFEEKGIQFRAFNMVKEKVKLPYGYNRQINLLFKEAMTNTFKHSSAGNVSLTVSVESGVVRFVFEDDGIGFNHSVADKSGIRNMEERAKKLNGSFLLQSSTSGTKVILTFTLIKDKYGASI